jgi:tRNA-specific adenosine deaminase 1
MKCLPHTKLPLAHGNILHDWHAEIIAIRAFNRYLLDECLLISSPPYPASPFLRQRLPNELSEHELHPYTIREGVSIHMYCSEAPCGDASMELTMAAQEDATPWTSAPATVEAAKSKSTSLEAGEKEDSLAALRGRSNFSLLGAVRCKPSRPDAPPTLSKSCTDKLAMKQATSLLCSVTSLLINPRNAYIDTLILPASQYVSKACERAFSPCGRLDNLAQENTGNWRGGYGFHAFKVKTTDLEFAWSRRAISSLEKAAPSNLSAVWTPNWQETLIGGVLQGRKQLDPRGASKLCRTGVWMEALALAGLTSVPILVEALKKGNYADMKNTTTLGPRRKVKTDMRTALGGWVKNTGDDEFTLKTTLHS